MTSRVAVVGWHNAGKTTVVEGLVREFRARGARVAVLKNASVGFQLDHPGTDTWRFAEAGANTVVITSRNGLGWLEQREQAPDLAELMRRLDGTVDLVILEGFKHEPGPKVEVVREATGTDPIVAGDDLVALVSDDPIDNRQVPMFRFDQVAALADLLVQRGLCPATLR
ncbi:MAG: molybdopterin-guanine dinucleotide biosynthesis protein B [Anaerolineae bacterium]|jgi:molybdopterin-guanine dinucleotide biosynthesis protein MobB|nr:molybdopterin-guanine dinucleotide biosynthesis protein B [Chloroflexota bacterium]